MTLKLAAAAALALALTAGAAGAQTFAVVPPSAELSPPPLVLPSSQTPNAPGSLRLPPDWTRRATAVRTLDEPTLRSLWVRAGAAYGISWDILAAINKIESNLGRNMGPSSAGAVGWMQFMPETWLRWGMDATGDGIADPWDPEDAMYSAARYLAAAGAARDLPRAIFAYNHAWWYVRDVLDLAAVYRSGGTDVLFSLDRVQAGLEQARAEVVSANRRLVAAVAAERALARRESELAARARTARLISQRLGAEKRATQAGVRREAARTRVRELRAALDAAEEELSRARERSRGAAFAGGTAGLMQAPSYAGDYVFPVAGGPDVVTAGRDHADYPAVDLAAPEGTPVYALTAATVLRSWSLPQGRCGIGATIRALDGRDWTYCHLSHLDPSALPGAVLAAGDPIGLVGSTGRSTGPHLHLQLQPATSWPQREPWFEAFAGSAFRWKGEEHVREPAAAGPRRTFAVVPPAEAEDEGVILFTR